MDIIKEIKNFQNELNVEINNFCEKMIQEIEKENSTVTPKTAYISTYPITNPTFFKGKKPVEVEIDGKTIITPTWKKVAYTILTEIVQDKNMESKLLGLRDVMLGRVRNRLSSSDKNMTSPLCITKDLYIETHYDTETLLKFLLQILDKIGYDYNNIKIKIMN